MSLIIKLVERNLLINSAIIDNYPNLKKLLDKHKIVSENMIENCIDMDKSTQEILQTKAYIEIYNVALREWIAEKHCDYGIIKCGLCNHKNHQIYYIKNTINGKRINVGSECIKHFPDLKNEQNVDMSEQIKRDRKTYLRVQRKIEFAKTFVNFQSKINKYKSERDHSEYLVNYEIYSETNEIINKLQELRDNYLDGKDDPKCFDRIKELIDKLDYIISTEIPKFNIKLSENEFACTKDIADWLSLSNKESKDLIIERIRKNNSCIGADSIIDISYIPFIEKLLEEYKAITEDIFYDIRIHGEGGSTKIYVNLRNKYLKNITFCCTPEVFMKKLGDVVFLDANHRKNRFSLKYLFDDFLSLYNDDDNIYILYSMLNDKFKGEYEFLYDYDFNHTYLINKVQGTFKQFDGTKTVIKYLLKYFSNDGFNYRCKLNFFSQIKWVTISDSMLDTINKCRSEFNNTQFSYY